MISNTGFKTIDRLPKCIRACFSEVSDERDTGDGVWAYCAPGYIIPDMDCGTAHEGTIRELVAVMRTARLAVEGEGPWYDVHGWPDSV